MTLPKAIKGETRRDGDGRVAVGHANEKVTCLQIASRSNQMESTACLKKNQKKIKSLGPPSALAADYFEITNDEMSGHGFTAHIEPQIYDEMVVTAGKPIYPCSL